jgi:TPR repeat protein
MGYYTEVGVGGPKDIEAAIKWYTRVRKMPVLLSLI